MNTRHLIDLDQLSIDEIKYIISLSQEIRSKPHEYIDVCHGKIMATLFYEPSTRTQMSFQTAMLRLGGQVIGFNDPNNSSVTKGESLKDTIRIVSEYGDIIILRNRYEGAAKAASLYSKCPVINAGDGAHLHPTQTLTDIVTMSNEIGRLKNLSIGVCGDLKNGRTVHSLIKCLSHYEGNRFILVSSSQLCVPKYLTDILDENNCEYVFSDDLSASIGDMDVLYMTRIQKERFESEEEYNRQKGRFILDSEKLKLAKKEMKILHPLPRVDEISDEVDEDPRAMYFKQAEYGLYARMALIINILEHESKRIDPIEKGFTDRRCHNPNCITSDECYLPNLFIKREDGLFCKYCDARDE